VTSLSVFLLSRVLFPLFAVSAFGLFRVSRHLHFQILHHFRHTDYSKDTVLPSTVAKREMVGVDVGQRLLAQ